MVGARFRLNVAKAESEIFSEGIDGQASYEDDDLTRRRKVHDFSNYVGHDRLKEMEKCCSQLTCAGATLNSIRRHLVEAHQPNDGGMLLVDWRGALG